MKLMTRIKPVATRLLGTLAVVALTLGATGCLNGTPAQSGVFVTKDAGTSWTATPDLTSPDTQKPDAYPPLEVNAVGVSRRDANFVVAGTGDDIYQSTDGGGKWERLTERLPSSTKAMTVQTVTFHPTQGNTYFLGGVSGGYGKVIRSSDDGKTLQDIFTVSKPGQSVTSIAVSPESGALFAGDQLGSVYRSPDGGTTWQRVFSVDRIPVTSLAVSGKDIYVGTGGEGIWRSTDGGTTFAPINGNLGRSNQTVWSLAAGFGSLYAGTDDGLFATRDFGASWAPVGNPLPADGSRILAIAISGSNLYFSTNAVVYRANPQGGNFTPVQLKLARNVFSLAPAATHPETIYAGASASGSDVTGRYNEGLTGGFNIEPN